MIILYLTHTLRYEYDQVLERYYPSVESICDGDCHAIILAIVGGTFAVYKMMTGLGSVEIDKDKTVNLAPHNVYELSFPTPFAGYIIVEFTATGGVYFLIGSSNTIPPIYARYPPMPPDTATSGKFIIPVTRGRTYVHIVNPSPYSGVTVTYTITYVS